MSLSTDYDSNNIFAKIIGGEMSCAAIEDTDATLAFMDVFPQSDGHCLVVHKTAKATNLLDIAADDLGVLTSAVQRIAKAVKDALNPDGIRIAQFNGAPAGQTVFHLHFHIIPVFEGKALAPHAGGGPVDTAILEATAAKIRAAL